MKSFIALMLSVCALSAFAGPVVECESPVQMPGTRKGEVVFRFDFVKQTKADVSTYYRSSRSTSVEEMSSKTQANHKKVIVHVDLVEMGADGAEFAFDYAWLRGFQGQMAPVQVMVFKDGDVTDVRPETVTCQLLNDSLADFF